MNASSMIDAPHAALATFCYHPQTRLSWEETQQAVPARLGRRVDPPDPTMEDSWYLEALQNYLNGEEWRDTVKVFVGSHCQFFSDIDDLHPQQHVVWKSFQDVVENILEMALMNVGGSLHELERSLDKVQARPSRGPRDETIKDVLHQLMTFDDFVFFSKMMNKVCTEELADQVYDINSNHYNVLMRMGFTVEAILATIDKAGREAPLEVLIATLGDASVAFSSTPTKSAKFDAKALYTSENPPLQYPNPTALRAFLEEAASAGQLWEFDDLKSKLRVADSLVDVYKQTNDISHLDHLGLDAVGLSPSKGGLNSDSMLDLVKWAAEMQQLQRDVHSYFEDGRSFHAPSMHHPKGLLAAYQDLQEAFDVVSKSGGLGASNELERLRELDRIAAGHNADEQYLYSCITNHESVGKEVNKLYKKCSIIAMTNPQIESRDLEEIYLFLKDQMQTDAAARDDENIYDNLHSNPIFHKLNKYRSGVECIQCLLDLHLLEEELMFLRGEIQRLVGGSPTRTEAKSGFNGSELGGEVVEGLSFNLLDDLVALDNAMLAADAKHEATPVDEGEKMVIKEDTGLLPSQLAALVKQHEHRMDGLKAAHRASLTALKAQLQQHKASTLQALEERLLRKRLLKRSLEKDFTSGEGDIAPQDIDEIQLEIDALERRIDSTSAQCGDAHAQVLESYRDKCVHELREAKAQLERRVCDGTVGDMQDVQEIVRAPGVQANVQNALLAGIKNRYAEERQRLLGALETQRRQQQDKLRRLLQARKATGSEAWAVEEQQRMDEGLAKDYAEQMDKATQDYIGAMAALSLDERVLAPLSREADEESYLDDVAAPGGSSSAAAVASYLDRVEAMKRAYVAANANLYESLLSKRKRYGPRKATTDRSIEDQEMALEREALEVMSEVVMDACDSHLEEAFAVSVLASSRTGRGMLEPPGDGFNERARAGILEAFEKAKLDLSGTQGHARAKALARLAARRQDKPTAGAGAGDGTASSLAAVEALLEGAVDSYLQAELPVSAAGEASSSSRRERDPESFAFDGEAADRQKKDALRQRHADRHKVLEEDLYADMMDKKRKLEDRIKRKRMQEVGAKGSLLDEDSQDQQQDLDLGRYHDAGQEGQGRDRPVVSNTQPVAKSVVAESIGTPDMLDLALGNATAPGDDSKQERRVGKLAPLPPIGAGPPIDYTSEAKRIAYTYNEEREKHDLLMKIQETRQRQQLQKKLWQRHQQRQSISAAEAPDDDETVPSATGSAAIDIGEFKSRIPSMRANLQPAVKGLSLDRIPMVADPKRTSSTMALRGLNLAPMQRK